MIFYDEGKTQKETGSPFLKWPEELAAYVMAAPGLVAETRGVDSSLRGNMVSPDVCVLKAPKGAANEAVNG